MNCVNSNQAATGSRCFKVRWGIVLVALVIIAATVAIRFMTGGESAEAGPPKTPARAPARPAPSEATPAPAQGKYVAQVNDVQVTRDELAHECLRHYGSEVLESMVNKYLISQECARRNISVTRAEVDEEIERMAQRFSLPVDRWLKMLDQERGIKPMQYASDVIWPTLALRKLAGDRLQVTEADVKAAYEMHYGASVRCRLIAVYDKHKAEEIRAKAAAKPEAFGDLAKQFSEDSSASVKGLIPPIRRHGSFPDIERTAFSLEDGQISEVIAVGDQCLILKRESMLPASDVNEKLVRPKLEEIVREKKMRVVAAEIFQKLQAGSRVENVLNDPAKRRAQPGVAALINGEAITLEQLAEQCLDRHGEDVLTGLIHRRLLELDCKKRKIAVTEADIDAEIARAAREMCLPKPDGSPDIETWLETVTEQQNVSVDVYRSDAVWPSVALKKLVGDDVKVTAEDIQKGYEANYGEKVRCLAIVLSNARRAQEVWELARRNPTPENFGSLAEAYSVEPGSQQLRGEVPPIQRHGGQPLLEKIAFSLKPGELSEIAQVGDKWIILLCEGYTEPSRVQIEEVRSEIYHDLFDKKQRLEMGKYFDELVARATITNYLAGTTSSPEKSRPSREASGPTTIGSRPRTTR